MVTNLVSSLSFAVAAVSVVVSAVALSVAALSVAALSEQATIVILAAIIAASKGSL